METKQRPRRRRPATSDFAQAESVYRQIVIPFAMPLLVGPGVIANLILYSVEAQKLKSASLTLG